MRSRRTSSHQRRSSVPPAERSRLSGPRALAVVALVALAMAGTAVGISVAGTSSGSAPNAVGKVPGADRPGARTAGKPARPAPKQTRKATPPANGPLRTSCQSAAHIGDSTSVDLVSTAYLPPSALLQTRYANVGVKHLNLDASGGRSMVEALPGQVNGYNVARAWAAQGFRGCWVLALGTNDAANVAVGSSVSLMARIDKMMAVAHGQPVMWVNTRTLLGYGPYANANEQVWNQTLIQALKKYPNMRIFDWNSVSVPGWFLSDGIHYNTFGAGERALAIANALAKAFPLNGHSKGQIIR